MQNDFGEKIFSFTNSLNLICSELEKKIIFFQTLISTSLMSQNLIERIIDHYLPLTISNQLAIAMDTRQNVASMRNCIDCPEKKVVEFV